MNSRRLSLSFVLSVILGLSCIESRAVSLDYYPYELNVSEGLSSNIVYSVLKWKDNNIWIATRQGVDCYDGLSYKHYSLFQDDLRTSENGRKLSISYNDSPSSSTQELWAYTDGGQVFRYDIEGDQFCLFVSLAKERGRLNSVYQINDYLYVCCADGILCYEVESGELVAHCLEGHVIKCIRPFVDNRLIAGGYGGLFFLTPMLEYFVPVESTEHLSIETLYVDNKNASIYIGDHGDGAWVMSNFILSRLEGVPSHSIVRSIVNLDDKSILFGCDGAGVYMFNRENGKASLFASDLADQNCLTIRTSSVYSILVDQENIWVACYRGGVSLFRKDSDYFLISDPDAAIASANYVHGLCAGSSNDMWMAFNSYIAHYDFTTGAFTRYIDRQGGFLAVAFDKTGTLWCGGYNTGLYQLNGSTGRYSLFPSISKNKERDSISSLLCDSKGDLWVGGFNIKLTRISYITKKVTQFDISSVNCLELAQTGDLLVGTANGLFILNTLTEELRAVDLSGDSAWKGSLYINSIAYSQQTANAWIGTDGGGLLCYNLNSGEITPYTMREGLPSNYIMAVEIDSTQRLWVSTENSGIFIFDTQSRKLMSSVKRNEGLYFNEFFPRSSAILSNGNIAFGGYHGAVVIPSLAVIGKSDANKITLSRLYVGREKISPRTHPEIIRESIDECDRIVLPSDKRGFMLSVSTDNLYYQHSVRLKWRLLGYHKDWHTLRQDRVIDINNLAAGRYVLEIAEDQLEDESCATRSLTIISKQVIWLRWYFILLYVLIVASIVKWIYSINRHRSEKQQFEEKIRLFSNLAHDIKSPLMLISAPLSKLAKMQSEQQDEQLRLIATATNSAKQLENLVGQLLDFEKLGLQSIHFETRSIDLVRHIEKIRYDYQYLAEEKGLYFNLSTTAGPCFVCANSSLLTRVLDNLLSNAIKYTQSGGISLSLCLDSDKAIIEVSDTGIGISKASLKKVFRTCFRGENAISQKIPGNGMGLFFTNTIVRAMGGELSCRSSLGKGSTFTLSIPTIQDLDQCVEEHTESPKPASYSCNKNTVLLVDDDDKLREFVAQSLGSWLNILQAPSAESAIKCLKSSSVDLVITDLLMPGMSGDKLCRRIKKNIETSHIPVIVFTASARKEAMTNSLSVGADDYLTKPVDLDVLELKIKNLFQNRGKLHSHLLASLNATTSPKEILSKPTSSEIDTLLLQKLTKLLQENLSNADFSVNDLCRELGVSRTILYEKTRKLLGLAPNDLIREIRMKQAKTWLEQEEGMSITDIAINCGFSDVRYFSTVFKKYYGISPSSVKPKRE